MTQPKDQLSARIIPRPAEIDSRKDGPNLRLMKAMGSRRGYDPIPPSQYEWQGVDGEPPLYRMWSWMCAHTIAHGRTSPFAVRADGTPATLKDLAADLGLDLSFVSNLWAHGTEKGLWARRAGRGLWLNGEVTAGQVREANTRRNVECKLNLSKRERLIINTWPEDRSKQFMAVWEAAQIHHRGDIAATLADRRKTHSAIDDSIRQAFALPQKRRADDKYMQVIELPGVIRSMMYSVHDNSAHYTPVECARGEDQGENVSVQPPASLLISEKSQKGLVPSASALLEQEAARLVTALQIDDDAAISLLENVRKVEPTATWRVVVELAKLKLKTARPKVSLAGFLIASIPKTARGATLAEAIAAAERAEMHAAAERAVLERSTAQYIRNLEADIADPRTSDQVREFCREEIERLGGRTAAS